MSISTICTNKEALVAYLYGECSATERDALDAHLLTCLTCATELREMRGVQLALSEWTPPDAELGFRLVQEPVARRARWFRPLPVWAQAAAAACLVLAGAAAIANVEIRYGLDGVVVRTGWSRPDTAASRNPEARVSDVAATPVAWRSELNAMADQLRNEFAAREARLAAASHDDAPRVGAARAGLSDADVRRVQTLIDQSERRQEGELALRIAQLVRDMNTIRQADLTSIDRRLGQVQNETGNAIAVTSDSMKKYTNLMVRTAQRQPQ